MLRGLIFIGLIINFFFFSCVDIIEKDIQTEKVELSAPFNGAESPRNDINFVWESLLGATSYNIRVVEPSFDSILNFVINEDVTETQFTSNLPSGNYQWTVIGNNSAYSSISDTFNLTVAADSSSTLTNQTVNLVSPAEDGISNNMSIDFLWASVAGANEYNIQIASPDFTNSTFILKNERVTGDNYNTDLSEGEYRWRVRAENAQGVSAYSEQGFIVDLSAPSSPTIVSPEDCALVEFPVTLQWQSAAESVTDTLYVYSDQLITPPILKINLNISQYDFSNDDFFDYYWRVRSVDAAGNTSSYSELRKFSAQ